MVATRRATRRSESEAGSSDPPAGAEVSMEGSASVRTTRSRSKVNSHVNVIPEYHLEKMEKTETKLDVEEPLTLSKSKAVHLADPVAELQADGEISEAESNCSSLSGLQTSSFIRITRRRQIVVPCQPEIPAKSRQSKKALPNEGSKCQDDDDISEAESCSSTVSGMRTHSVTRRTRSRQVKTNVAPVCESQTEEVSDTESWCSGISSEPSVPFQRMTRSMRLKLKAETSQPERKSEVVPDDADLPECAALSQTIVISDSEQPTKSDLDAEQASNLSPNRINKQLSPCKTKCHSESVVGNDLKQISSSSPKKMARECVKKSPEKERLKDNDYESVGSTELKAGRDKVVRESDTKQISADVYEIVESPEVVCNQTLEKSIKVTENQSPIKTTDMCHPDQSNISPTHTTPSKIKSNVESQKLGTRKVKQGCLHHVEETIDEPSEVGGPQTDTIPSQTVESSDDEGRVSVVSINSDESPEEPVAESSSSATKTTGRDKCFTVSLLTSDETEESENSDLEEMNEKEMTASCADTGNQRASTLTESQGEELFVIDKTPGLDPGKAYYLEKEEDTMADEESEESSDLEDDEEEFIDEAEDVLNANNEILSLSSSIDPGLNIKQLGGLYITFDAGKQKPGSQGVVPLKEKKKDELLQKSIITPDFEKKECIPPIRESIHQLKKQRRAERAKTTGDGWFGMKAPEMTDELKNDLKALKMRTAIDPKRFYKKNDREGPPKYFQVGTVVDSPADFYHARIPKKERKKNIVEELLADSEFRRYNKRKYQDIIAEKAALAAGKKNRKKKKFRK
ncbi:deoxynucleotidyltransferase terminal-interacting protein 2 [Elgaria multicarinata webbii]|uniref:deoxynucleotidyltransferase terminal-interacting protein 2 n=1 Tax=Elgaria multicarinata webbii TaxID=159646 RepID=UPI002FCCBF2D